MLTFEDIFATIEESESTYNRYNIEAKRPGSKLPVGYILDEDKSVKWNREQVALHNMLVEAQWRDYHEAYSNGWFNFRSDLKEAIHNEYGFSEDQAACILGQIVSGDMQEVATKAEEMCEFLLDFLGREGPKEIFSA